MNITTFGDRPNLHISFFEALNKKTVYALISEVGLTTVAKLHFDIPLLRTCSRNMIPLQNNFDERFPYGVPNP
jgi:hypothetical protein